MIDVYLELHHVSPPSVGESNVRRRGQAPAHPLRPFNLAKVNGEFIHRLAQHCICDEIDFVDLYDMASVLQSTPADRCYATIIVAVAVAIRSKAAYSPYSRAAYRIVQTVLAGDSQ